MTLTPPRTTLFPYTTLFRSEGVVARDAEQAEPDDEHPGDGAGAEGDAQRRLEAVPGGLGGPHVRADRDVHPDESGRGRERGDRKSTRLNSSHVRISYAVFCL